MGYSPSLSPSQIASSDSPIAPTAVTHYIAAVADASFIIAARPIFANPRQAGASFATYRASRFPYSAANCFRSAIRA